MQFELSDKIKVLCDFDGTAAENDVGNLLFRTFADNRCFDIVAAWKSGEINSKECLRQECAIARVSRAQLASYADSQKLAPHFPEFVAFCEERGVPVEIVSDGLDFYIERILHHSGLNGSLEVHANHLLFLGDDRIDAEFPYFENGCGECGNCKGYHVATAHADGFKVVYIGDGLSDRCGARTADLVFTKRGRDLLRFCRESGLPHIEFDTFADVTARLQKMLSPKTGI